MIALSRGFTVGAGQRWLIAIVLLVCPFAAAGQGVADGFALRNQNPFLQIFGLPTFQSATLTEPGATGYDVSLDIVNHADDGDNGREDFVIDGESYLLSLSFRRRISDRFEFGLDVPFIAHEEGFLDNAIESWHDMFGMSNTNRRGASNLLDFRYTLDGVTRYDLDAPVSGIGDIQLSAAMRIRQASENDGFALALRSSVKLPTGDEKKLLGSGAADVSLGLHASDTHTLFGRNLGISGFAGVLLLGDGDVIGDLQRSAVPYGGIAATWQATERLGMTAQLYTQGKYFDSDLKELGGESIQLGVGGDYRWPQQGVSLKLAIVEDIKANATPDFALHFSVGWEGGR